MLTFLQEKTDISGKPVGQYLVSVPMVGGARMQMVSAQKLLLAALSLKEQYMNISVVTLHHHLHLALCLKGIYLPQRRMLSMQVGSVSALLLQTT